MKLNHDLIRELLLHIEEISDGNTNFPSNYFLKPLRHYPERFVTYHLKFLLDAGLIEGKNGYITDITPYGRNYLDNIRNETIWIKTKNRLQPVGSVTLSVISEVAKSFILSKLGL